jgi:hypothetical protein
VRTFKPAPEVKGGFRISALTFSPLPQERKWLSAVLGLADHDPTNPVAGLSTRRRTILHRLGEEGRDEGERKHSFHFREMSHPRCRVAS